MGKVFIGYDTYGVEGVDDEFIHFICDIALSHTGCPPDSELGLVITSDDHVQALNHKYRGIDKTTNVLSFANDEDDEFPRPADGEDNYLGDIYISYPQLAREAKQLQVSHRQRFVQLFVHGMLHLLGFDHEDEQDAEVMERLEDKIIQSVV
jgi:probable rRNA maturation factor